MKAIKNVYPPEFCWKKGGDVGKIPTGCPNGYFRSLALCYQYCKSGYTFVLGVCWQNCPKGTDIGALCVDWFYIHAKHSYIPHALTNFSSKIPCPYNMYKSGALCYRDCNGIGMTNCGVGACTRDSAACGVTVMNMIVEIINSIVSVVVLVVSFGTSSAATPAMHSGKTALKQIGQKAMNAGLKGLKNYLQKKGKKFLREKTSKLFRDKIKQKLKEKAISVSMAASAAMLCDNMAKDMFEKTEKKNDEINLNNFVEKLDVLQVGDAVDKC